VEGTFPGQMVSCPKIVIYWSNRSSINRVAILDRWGGCCASCRRTPSNCVRDRLEDRAHTLSAAHQSGEPGLAFLVQAPREASGTQGHHSPRFPITTTARDDQDERRALIPAPAFLFGRANFRGRRRNLSQSRLGWMPDASLHQSIDPHAEFEVLIDIVFALTLT